MGCCNPVAIFVIQVVYASAGILAGITVAVYFLGSPCGNPSAGGWGAASAVLASLNLALYIYAYLVGQRRRRPLNPILLCFFSVEGILSTGVGLAAFISYLGIAIDDTQRSKNSGSCSWLIQSSYVTSVWAFMVMKWGLSTFFFAVRKLKNNTVAVSRDYEPVNT